MNGIITFITKLVIITKVTIHAMKPEQIHLSLGNRPGEMVVMWSTSTDQPCHVMYSTAHSNTTSVNSKSIKLSRDSWNAVPYIHRAVLKNLTEGYLYQYCVKCNHHNQTVESDRLSFRTKSSNEEDVRLLVFSDLASTADRTFSAIADDIATTDYDALLHIGDIAYDLHDDGGRVGDEFMQKMENVSKQLPYLTSPGDHEKHDDFYHYRTRFSSPGIPWPMLNDRLWYSVNIGPIHLISYSTEVYFTPHVEECDQYNWLLNDLEQANKNRKQQPWIVAMGHRPMYCSGLVFDDCADGPFQGWVKQGLETLFYSGGVDLILEAHEHIYERSWPVYDGHPTGDNYNNPSAPIHIITGSAGELKQAHGSSSHEDWTAYRLTEACPGMYGRLYVANATHLSWDLVSVKDNKIIDRVCIIQEDHGPFSAESDCGHDQKHRPSFCVCPSTLAVSYTLIAVVSSVSLSLLTLGVIYWRFRCIHKQRKQVYATVSTLEPENDDLIQDNEI